MTPTQRLVEKLNEALRPHGMAVWNDTINFVKGAQRHMDLCRWSGMVTFAEGDGDLPVWSIASWDTITDCLRGFKIEFRPRPKAEAEIMVHATH